MQTIGHVFYASGNRGTEIRADGKGGTLRKGYYFRTERDLHGPFRSVKIASDAQVAVAHANAIRVTE
mgnify:CR=1 FL=1